MLLSLYCKKAEKLYHNRHMQTTPLPHVLILHDVRSAQNVGALFRTADAVGIKKIFLSAITPQPIDRFGRSRKDLAKTALGSEKTLSWESYEDPKKLIAMLKQSGYTVVAIEQAENAIDYKTITTKTPLAFMLGNEVSGIPKTILGAVDTVVQIPMFGEKESLNVSVAGGIVLFRTLDY